MQYVKNRGNWECGKESTWECSVLSVQFFCEIKCSLENKVIFSKVYRKKKKIKLNSEALNTFPPKMGNKARMSTLTISVQLLLEVLASTIS